MFTVKVWHQQKITTFYEVGWKSLNPSENKWSFNKWLDFVKWAYELATDKEARDLAFKTADAITEAENSNDPIIKKTLELLKATGTIQMWLFDRVRTVARFSEWSGKSWAKAILKAFEDAKKWIISIVLYAKNSYTPMSMKEYEEKIKNRPDEMNIWVSQGLWWLYEQGNNLGFWKETWSNISLYAADKWWNTGIIGWNEKMKTSIQKIYSERKVQEEKKIDSIIQSEFQGIEKTNPLLIECLKKYSLKYNERGNIDAWEFINKMDVSNLNEIPTKFDALANNLKGDAKELEKRAKDIFWSLSGKNAKAIGIPGLDDRLSRLPFIAYTQSDAVKTIDEAQKLRDKLAENDPKKWELSRLIIWLATLHTAIRRKKEANDANIRANQARRSIEEAKKRGVIPTKESIVKDITTERSENEVTFAKKLWEKRDESERSKDLLSKYGIRDYESAGRKLSELEKKENLTEEEKDLIILLKDYRRSKNSEAQVYQASVKEFWHERAKELFTVTNRFTSDNPEENYNFQALEKIATITDPEASGETKSLYNLTSEDTPFKLENTSGYEESYFLGNSSLYATSAWDWYVYLTSKDGRPLIDTKLLPYQVESVKKQVLALQSIWMESLLPILPELSNMIWGGYRVNGFDGELTDGELNRLLSAMEKLTLEPGEYPTVGNNLEKIKSIRSKATLNGRLAREYYDGYLRTAWFLNDDGTPRREAISQRIQS